jgi:hypothetical protein
MPCPTRSRTTVSDGRTVADGSMSSSPTQRAGFKVVSSPGPAATPAATAAARAAAAATAPGPGRSPGGAGRYHVVLVTMALRLALLGTSRPLHRDLSWTVLRYVGLARGATGTVLRLPSPPPGPGAPDDPGRVRVRNLATRERPTGTQSDVTVRVTVSLRPGRNLSFQVQV